MRSVRVGLSPPLETGRQRVFDLVVAYLETRAREQGNPVHIDVDPPIVRARMQGETRDVTTIWFIAGPRTLRYEAYFLPDPEENHEAVYRYLLRWNRRLYLAAFAVDPDGEVYLRGRIPLEAVTEDEVDRITGQLFQAVESTFRTAIRLAFPRLFPPDT